MIPDADMENTVRRQLDRAAERVSVESGPVESVLRRARRRSVMRLVSTATAALLVVALFAWGTIGLRGIGGGDHRASVGPATGSMQVDRIDVRGYAGKVLAADGFVWTLVSHANDEGSSVVRIDPQSLETVGQPFRVDGPLVSDMAVGQGGVWLSKPTLTGPSWDKEPGVVERLDPSTGAVVATIQVGRHPAGIAIGAGSVWVGNETDDSVSRIDPATNAVVATIPVGDGPDALVFGFGTLWVENTFNRTSIMRIDPATNTVVATISDLVRPVMSDGIVWVVGPGKPNGVVEQLDPQTNSVPGDGYHLDIGPGYVAAGDGTVWIGKWYESPDNQAAFGLFQGTFEYRRYDPDTNTLVGPSIAVNGPTPAMIADGAFWAPLGRAVIHAQLPP